MEVRTMTNITEDRAKELMVKGIANLTNDELLEFVAYTKSLATSATKQAKERKLTVPSTKRVATVQSPELALLAEAFEAIIAANLELIAELFPAPTPEKPFGQKGVNVSTGKDCKFYIQILNKAAYEAERADKKAKAVKEVTPEQVAAAEAAKAGTI
jgi:hypothetical protein